MRGRRESIANLIADGKLCIGDGYRAKNDELAKHGIPFARAGNIDDGFHFEGADCFPDEDLPKVGQKVSQPGDVVFTSKGTVGRFAFVRENTPRFVYSPQLCFWRSLDNRAILPRYLYFWMSSREFFEQYSGVAGQTDMAEYVSLRDQRRMHITLPSPEAQATIAQVLGSLDDKIELNRRMNETLDAEMAAIFESTFSNGEIGPVGEVVTVSREIIDPAEFQDEIFDHYSIPAFDLGRTPVIELGSKIKSAKLAVSADSVLVSRLNPRVPRVWLPALNTARRSICSTEFLVAMPRGGRAEREFLYGLFRSKQFLEGMLARAAGTSNSHQRVRPDDLLGIICEIGTDAGRRRYSEVVRPLFERMAANLRESLLLASTRDSLLPKLLSGEVSAWTEAGVAE